LNRILRNLTYAVIDLLGDGSSLSVRPSHPYEEGIYVFVQANPWRKMERGIRNNGT
jgi:hypothetical protein